MSINLGAQGAINEIRELATTLKELKSVVTGLSKNVSSLQGSLNGVGGVSADLDQKFKNLSKSQKSAFTQVRNLKKVNLELSEAYKKQNAQLEKLKKNNKSILGGLGSLLRAFGLIAGVQLFANVILNSVKLITTFDSLHFALERITKNSYDLAESNIFLNQITKDYGATLIATTERWIKFLAAAKQSGITLKDTQKIFGTMTKAAGVLGLKTDELRGIYLALEQMLSKGKVTTEELRRQLGERLPGAMGIMAASIGVTISKLDKMMKKGEVLSAEVLPGFADAVEIAFGLQTVNKIETIIAKQNRVTRSWQALIKSIGEGDGVIKFVIGGFYDLLGGVLERLDWLLMSSEQKFTVEVGKMMKTLEKEQDQQAKSVLNAKAKEGMRYKDLVKNVNDYEVNLSNATTDKQKKDIEEKYANDMKLLIEYNNEKNKLIKEQAKLGLTNAKKTLDEDTALLEAKKNRIAELEGIDPRKNSAKEMSDVRKEIRGVNDEIEELEDNLIESKARFMLFRTQAEDSKVVIDSDDEEPETTKKLRKIFDKQREIRANDLQARIEENEVNIDLEEISYTLKKELLLRNLALEKEINDLILEDKIIMLESKAKEEIDAAGVGSARAIELEKEKAQNILLLNQDLSAKKISLEKKTQEKIENLAGSEMVRFQEEFEEIKRANEIKKNAEIKSLNETATSAKELKDGMDEINQRYWEEENEALIKSVKSWIAYLKLLKLSTGELERLLETLETSSNKPSFGDDEEKEKLLEWLDVVRDVFAEIGNLADAVFERRIENINAEIDAETKKYDKLLELEANNKNNTEALEKQKAVAIALLEKKRLKEEQKQAKARKAAALVDIAINTAIGISASTKTGPLGLWAIPIIAALGALQIATVLAQPIPQYKDGLDEAKKDHIAMINDGSSQEYVERGGKILTTKTKNAIVGLKKGDTVHKDYDSMVKNSILLSAISNGSMLSQNNFEGLDSIIEKGLINGFKKAKINNNLKLVNNLGNSYKESLSRWN